jgi:hypothetical protein
MIMRKNKNKKHLEFVFRQRRAEALAQGSQLVAVQLAALVSVELVELIHYIPLGVLGGMQLVEDPWWISRR